MKITISLFAGRKRIDELLRANNALVEEKRAANKSIAMKRDLISSYLSRSSRDAAEIGRLWKEIYRLTASAAASTPADDASNMVEPSRSASPDGIMASDGFGKPIIFGRTVVGGFCDAAGQCDCNVRRPQVRWVSPPISSTQADEPIQTMVMPGFDREFGEFSRVLNDNIVAAFSGSLPASPSIAELLAKIEGIVWAPNPPPPTHFTGFEFWLGAEGEPAPEPTTDEILRRGVGDAPISAK